MSITVTSFKNRMYSIGQKLHTHDRIETLLMADALGLVDLRRSGAELRRKVWGA